MGFAELVGYHLKNLANFTGREERRRFWPWAGLVIVGSMGGMIAAMVPVMLDSFAKVRRFAIEHPDQVTETRGPGSYSVQVHGYHPELMPDIDALVGGMALVIAVTVLLLAAAVVRRLHDCGRRGLWGALPLPFLASGLALMPRLFHMADPDFSLFALLFANNLVYIASLILLVVLLAGRGTAGANRYGPPPAS